MSKRMEQISDWLDALKADTEKVNGVLEDLVAKGGPGSGPHAGGGEASHAQQASDHRDAAAYHKNQKEQLSQAARGLAAAGYDKQANALHQEIGAHAHAENLHESAASAHGNEFGHSYAAESSTAAQNATEAANALSGKSLS